MIESVIDTGKIRIDPVLNFNVLKMLKLVSVIIECFQKLVLSHLEENLSTAFK